MAVVLIILAVVVVYGIVCYNSLTKAKNRIELAEQELIKYQESGDDRDIDNAMKYYNTMVEAFPARFIAELFNFPKMHSEHFDEGL